jgi:hypothetical protein
MMNIEDEIILSIEDIADIRTLNRFMLLAVAALLECDDRDELTIRAVEYNAHGWTLGIITEAGYWPTHDGIIFTPTELERIVRLARYFITRDVVEGEPADPEAEAAAGQEQEQEQEADHV